MRSEKRITGAVTKYLALKYQYNLSLVITTNLKTFLFQAGKCGSGFPVTSLICSSPYNVRVAMNVSLHFILYIIIVCHVILSLTWYWTLGSARSSLLVSPVPQVWESSADLTRKPVICCKCTQVSWPPLPGLKVDRGPDHVEEAEQDEAHVLQGLALPVEEDPEEKPDQRGHSEGPGVVTQPREIKRDFDSEIFRYLVWGHNHFQFQYR